MDITHHFHNLYTWENRSALFSVVGSIQSSEYVEMGIVGTISEVQVLYTSTVVFTVSRIGASESWVCVCVCVCVCVNLLGIDVEFFRSF